MASAHDLALGPFLLPAFHGLRKAATTRLIDAGCDVVEAAAIIGHASLKELQRYIDTCDP